MAATYTNEQVWDGLTERYGRGWDDETDTRTRYGDDEQPRVERIVKRTAPPHVPGSHWEATACLCSCHYVARTTCDDRDCARWGKQNADRVARDNERKARRKAARLAREAKASA